MNSDNTVTIYELKKLLNDLKNDKPEVSVRLRLAGQEWWRRSAKVVYVEDNKAIFNDESQSALIIISSLADVIEVELDGASGSFQPNCHYKIVPFS